MKRNENIFISLEIQKDLESKGLLLTVQFDRNAPNFLQDNQIISWCPTCDELNFISEAFALIGSKKVQMPEKEEKEEIQQDTEISMEEDQSNFSHRSSEIRIAPIPNNMTLEEGEETGTAQSNKKDYEERIFVQADDKKIDEILKRKKQTTKEQYPLDTDEKTLIDRMMKQKKKK